MLTKLSDWWFNWKLDRCIACPKDGYPASEARYTSVFDWFLAQLGYKEY